MNEEEKLKLVRDFDVFIQENNKELDRQLGFIYGASPYNDGWEEIQEKDPVVFEKALNFVLKNKDLLK